ESRVLLSATWSTVDSLPTSNGVMGMTADSAGNVYAVGDMLDAGGQDHAVVRVKTAGSSSWSTLATIPANPNSLPSIAADGKGNVFVSGASVLSNHWT